MTAYTGTNVITPRFSLGEVMTMIGEFDLADGAPGLANGDTITWPDFFPDGFTVTPVLVHFYSVEVDTDASATGTATIGNADDADGYIATFALFGSATPQLYRWSDGALIGTAIDANDLVLTVTAAIATTATTGKIFVKCEYFCGDVTQ